jgi:ABC-2 type transport system ATP-binding protein
MTAVIEIEGLRKEYRRLRGGRHVAVGGLDLSVPAGGVFGFLGPNGSGKTTTIRCLLGLVRATSGRTRLLGRDTPAQLPDVIGRVGSIVETPAFFPGFTGRRNLTLLARMGGVGVRRVEEMLELVGLAARGDDTVRRYSLGMRQRLGIAAALLKDPEVVILDEPANGLDPAGMREIRLLLRTLADEGRTVFVSSHLLSEVEQVCDRVAIISRGRAVVDGPVRDVLDRGAGVTHLVRVSNLRRGAAALRGQGFAVTRDADALRVDAPGDAGARITEVLAGAGQWVSELRPQQASLEDLFLEVTSDVEVPA